MCGALLALEQIETVTPGQGVPCTSCLHLRRTAAPVTSASVPGSRVEGGDGEGNPPVAAATGYRGLCGWTISLRRDQVWLRLDRRVTALLIPTGLATDAQAILTARGRPAPVLTHPDVPGQHVMLAGEPSEVPLPWASQARRAIGTLPLPPTMTRRGPLSWIHLPEADPARLCRESDLFAAVRTALRSPPPPSRRRGTANPDGDRGPAGNADVPGIR